MLIVVLTIKIIIHLDDLLSDVSLFKVLLSGIMSYVSQKDQNDLLEEFPIICCHCIFSVSAIFHQLVYDLYKSKSSDSMDIESVHTVLLVSRALGKQVQLADSLKQPCFQQVLENVQFQISERLKTNLPNVHTHTYVTHAL